MHGQIPKHANKQTGGNKCTHKQIKVLPITLVPLYLGGIIPENVGTKQEARITLWKIFVAES